MLDEMAVLTIQLPRKSAELITYVARLRLGVTDESVHPDIGLYIQRLIDADVQQVLQEIQTRRRW